MKHVALMTAVVLLAGLAEGQEWIEGQPTDSTLHVEPLGGDPDELWTLTDHLADATFRCHGGFWRSSDSQTFTVWIDHCWSEDVSAWEGGGGYTGEGVGTDLFVDWYFDGRRDKAEKGPTIETAIGEVIVYAFDAEKDRSHARYRECMGFHAAWDRGPGRMRDLFAKTLVLVACDLRTSTMWEAKFTWLLSGISIDGEFEALVDPQY